MSVRSTRRQVVAGGVLLLALISVLSIVALDADAAGAYEDFLLALARRESGDRANPSGNPFAVNPFGYAGLYQMGEAALIDAGYYQPDGTAANDWAGTWTGNNGINSLADFLDNPAKQTQAITAYHQRLTSSIRSLGLDKFIGRTLGGVLVTESGMIAGAHLVGIGGLQQFLSSGGGTVPRDGNGTALTTYLSMFGGFAIGAILPSNGGTALGTPLPNVPSTTLPEPYSSIPISPATAFVNATGNSPADVKLLIAMLIAVFYFLWVVWTSISHFNSWRKGEIELMQFQGDLVRAVIVLMVMIVVVQ